MTTAPAPGNTPAIVHGVNGPVTELSFCERASSGEFIDIIFNGSTNSCTAGYCSGCRSTPNGPLILNAGEKITEINSEYKSDKVTNPTNTNTST